jgi:hypothetical protein
VRGSRAKTPQGRERWRASNRLVLPCRWMDRGCPNAEGQTGEHHESKIEAMTMTMICAGGWQRVELRGRVAGCDLAFSSRLWLGRHLRGGGTCWPRHGRAHSEGTLCTVLQPPLVLQMGTITVHRRWCCARRSPNVGTRLVRHWRQC